MCFSGVLTLDILPNSKFRFLVCFLFGVGLKCCTKKHD